MARRFSTFVEEYRVELLRAARLLTAGDRYLAEDLVQTGLVRLYSTWPRLREKPIASENHTAGTKITVDGRPGYLRTQEKTQILSYQSSTGLWVDIQAPTLLGWDSTTIAKFAAGVTVSKKAATGGKG